MVLDLTGFSTDRVSLSYVECGGGSFGLFSDYFDLGMAVDPQRIDGSEKVFWAKVDKILFDHFFLLNFSSELLFFSS